MRIDRPDITPPASGDYRVRVSKGYGDPRGTITLDETSRLELEGIRIEDCDRLIRAIAEIKTGILANLEKAGFHHGRDHFYRGECQLCGKSEDDELHAAPAPDDDDESGEDATVAIAESSAAERETPLPLACGCTVPLGHLNIFRPGHPVVCIKHGSTTVAGEAVTA